MTDCDTVPAEFEAVSVYVMFSGLTVLLPVKPTSLMPWSMITLVAPVTFHCSTGESACDTVLGVTVKLVITGLTGLTVICVFCVMVPRLFVAVIV